MELLNENISHEDLKKYIKELYNYASKKLNIDVPPRLFLRRDKANAEDILGKTGGYDPDNQEIHLYVTDRHPKDILRSLAHELVHHSQKLAGFDADLNIGLIHQDPAYASHDEGLREMERDAFERGNMIFRDWTDGKKIKRKYIMSEKIDEATFQDKVDAIKKTGKSEESAKKIAGAMVRDEKKPHKKKKKMKESEHSEHVKMAQEQALADAKARYGSTVEEEQLEEQGYESVEAPTSIHSMNENTEKQEHSHPYPQLFEEKPRLMQDAFNKKEDLVYQELIRRFIKK
jgi:hypothetical protein